MRGNPVNFTDPSGTVVWRQASTKEHKAIETFYEIEFGNYQVHREFGRHQHIGRPIDLIYFPIVTGGSARGNFKFGQTLGEVYEIEPIHKWNEPGEGIDQVNDLITLLVQEQDNLRGKVKDMHGYGLYHDWDYDWRRVRWDRGIWFDKGIASSGIPKIHKVRVPDLNNRLLLVWLHKPGLIVYLDPTKDHHKKVLVEDSEFAEIRFRVVAKASHEFQEYREQLESETLSCYAESFWNPDYVYVERELPKTIWDIIKEIFNYYQEHCSKNCG